MMKHLTIRSILNITHYCSNQLSPAAFNLSRHISLCVPNFRTGCPGQHKRLKEYSDSYNNKWGKDLGTWSDNNLVVYPPLSPEEGIRPAEIYHGRQHCRIHIKKMFQESRMVRNLNVDEAIAKLHRLNTKAAQIIKDVIIEAQDIAVNQQNVEFKSNLHIVRSFTVKSGNIKFVREHARGMNAMNQMRFTNYYLLLREGPAPPHKPLFTAVEASNAYYDELRARTIYDGL